MQSWSAKKKKKNRKYNDERYLLFNILFFENNILNDRKLFNYKILRNVTNNNIPLKMMKRNGKTCWCVTFYAVISKFMLVILRAFFQLQGNAILDSFVFFRYEKKNFVWHEMHQGIVNNETKNKKGKVKK